MTTHLTYTATCHSCDWTHEGDDANSKAEAHTKRTGHATETRGVPTK